MRKISGLGALKLVILKHRIHLIKFSFSFLRNKYNIVLEFCYSWAFNHSLNDLLYLNTVLFN